MKIKLTCFLPALFFLLMSFMSPAASALTRVVVTDMSQCPPDQTLNPCTTSLATAVAGAAAGDSIEIRPGTYNESGISISKNLSSIYGLNTAATILNGSGSPSAILLLENIVSTITVRNLTFSNSAAGIVVRNTSAQIKNNIFELGTGSTAVQTINSATSTVANNTFFQNGTGIASDTLNLNIINNIFSQTTGATAIAPATMELTSIRNNLFFQGSIGPTGVLVATTMPISSDPVASNPGWQGNIAGLDPLFVDTTSATVALRDFHLKAGTPCQDTGNASEGVDSVDTTPADIGAYGGGGSDTIPFPVSGVASSATATTPATVTLSWSANSAYTVKGYNVYYGYQSGVYNGTDAVVSGGTATSASPIDAGSATTTSLIVSNAAVTTAAPVLGAPTPLNGSLKLSWSQVAGATGYTIYYSLASAPTITFPAISAGASTTYTLSGLVNGELYNVLVKAVSQATYYFAVTAYDTNTATGTPGTAHESSYSAEKSVPVGAIAESGPSNMVTGMPETITPLPDLPNTGCFIATAAYGSPLAPSVQVLREFRDRFLETNAPGRAFVRWYYANGPAGARYLNDHPALKPLAQAALAPFVAAALFLTRTTPVFQTAVLLALIGLAASWYRRSRVRIPAKENPR